MSAPAPKRRGEGILVVMQALRAHRAAEPATGTSAAFDEAHTVIDALQAQGYVKFPKKEQ